MKKIFAIVDKEFPPNHSFIDGMLSSVLPREKDIEVNLIVSNKGNKTVCRYNKAACLPLLYPRKKIYRFFNIIIIFSPTGMERFITKFVLCLNALRFTS